MPALSEVLSRHGVNSIRRAFPDLVAAAPTRIESPEGLRRVYVLRAVKAVDRKTLIRELLELPEVLYVEPNGMAVARVTPNDTHYTKQWSLENLAQAGGQPDADVDADLAWDVTTGASTVKIGIVDVGRVLSTHPDLTGRVSGNLSTPVHDHATHVAGIAAAKGNNNAGIAGVNWNALINTQTTGDLPTTAAAIRAAISSGARVINNSWGQNPPGFSTTVAWAFADAYKGNVISCNAMPETGSSQDEPNIYGQGNLNVAASTTSDTKALYSIARSYVDVMAPGGKNDGNALHNILSTVPGTTAYGQYDFKAGTSMAAPHVAGIASLLLSYRSTLFNDDIEKLVQISADKVAAMNGQSFTQDHGYGRANARRALDYLRAPYELVHRTATGGSVFSSTGTYSLVFLGAPGLADSTYFVRRHEVRKTVSFPTYTSPQVWGRGLATTGWSNTSPHFGTPWAEVVPGTRDLHLGDLADPSVRGVDHRRHLLGLEAHGPCQRDLRLHDLGRSDTLDRERLGSGLHHREGDLPAHGIGQRSGHRLEVGAQRRRRSLASLGDHTEHPVRGLRWRLHHPVATHGHPHLGRQGGHRHGYDDRLYPGHGLRTDSVSWDHVELGAVPLRVDGGSSLFRESLLGSYSPDSALATILAMAAMESRAKRLW